MRRLRVLLAVAGVALSSCVAQTPPERSPLPDVGALVPEPPPCGFLLGEGLGVEIDEVMEGTGASGLLQPGDMVRSVDGVRVMDAAALREVLGERSPGDVVTLDLLRGGRSAEVEVTLGTNPDDATRPLMGVLISTRFERTSLDELPPGTGVGSRLARLIQIEGGVYAFNPSGSEAVEVDVPATDDTWFAIDGTTYAVEGDISEDASIVGDDGGEVPLPEGIEPLRLVGVAGEDLLASVFDLDVESAVLVRVSPGGEVRWAHQPVTGLVVGALSSPTGERIAIAIADTDTDDLSFAVLGGTDGAPQLDEPLLEPLTGGAMFGWFDEQRLLVQPPGSGLALLDAATGTVTPVDLPMEVEEGMRLWAVGDGAHILVHRGHTLFLSGVEPGMETRELLTHCQVGAVGFVGSGTR